MRRTFLAVSLTAAAFFSVASGAIAQSASSSSSCPAIDAEIRACEANNQRYETSVDDMQCKHVKCIQPGQTCPDQAGLLAAAKLCVTSGKLAEKFYDGTCTVVRCTEPAACPTERQNNDVIAKCKAAGKDYEYIQKDSCSIAQCESVQTCPTNYELDRAVAACTKKGETYEYTHDGACRRVECVESDCQEAPGFRTASWECYDGFARDSGDEGTCRASESWRAFAADECKGRCSPNTGKCGVNSFSLGLACGGTTACENPSQSCPSMEENIRLTDACTAKGGTPTASWDRNDCKHVSCEGTEDKPANYQPEQAGCKELRSKLVRLKNAGQDNTPEFSKLSGQFDAGCQTGIRTLPVASADEPVLEDDTCSDYDNPYPDVAQCTTEGQAAAELYRRDIATGMPDGTFDGDAPLNRAQTAKFLLRACNLSEDKQSGRSAPDIDSTQWYAPLMRSAMALGVILGNPDGTVRPDQTVNHAEFTAMLLRACGIQPVGWPVCAKDVQPDDWFASGAAVAEAYQLYPDSNWLFEPGAEQTRSETAVAIYQYLKNRDAAPVPNSNSACFILGDTPATSSSVSSDDGDAGFSAGIQ